MCLRTLKTTEIKIAEEDIIVHKEFLSEKYNLFLTTPYNRFQYKFNELFETEIGEGSDIYAFSGLDMRESEKYSTDELKYINYGFHSMKDSSIFEEIDEDSLIYEAIIPKGSEYIEGFCGLIVSNKIIITKKLIKNVK